jgi:hypothetical protein
MKEKYGMVHRRPNLVWKVGDGAPNKVCLVRKKTELRIRVFIKQQKHVQACILTMS